jgi:hypothetical protein
MPKLLEKRIRYPDQLCVSSLNPSVIERREGSISSDRDNRDSVYVSLNLTKAIVKRVCLLGETHR